MFHFVDVWRTALGQDRHPVRTDAVEFAALACKRYAVHSPIENYAPRVDDIGDHIRNNPYAEVASLVVMKCDWFPSSEIIGIAHFRRSWANNLIIDYISSHPFIAKPVPGADSRVSGVATGLLYFNSEIAARYRCGSAWGEATQNSREFYERLFNLRSVGDLLYIRNEKLMSFNRTLNCEMASRTMKSLAKMTLDEIFDLETAYSPLVGSRTAVFMTTKDLGLKQQRQRTVTNLHKVKYLYARPLRAKLAKKHSFSKASVSKVW